MPMAIITVLLADVQFRARTCTAPLCGRAPPAGRRRAGLRPGRRAPSRVESCRARSRSVGAGPQLCVGGCVSKRQARLGGRHADAARHARSLVQVSMLAGPAGLQGGVSRLLAHNSPRSELSRPPQRQSAFIVSRTTQHPRLCGDLILRNRTAGERRGCGIEARLGSAHATPTRPHCPCGLRHRQPRARPRGGRWATKDPPSLPPIPSTRSSERFLRPARTEPSPVPTCHAASERVQRGKAKRGAQCCLSRKARPSLTRVTPRRPCLAPSPAAYTGRTYGHARSERVGCSAACRWHSSPRVVSIAGAPPRRERVSPCSRALSAGTAVKAQTGCRGLRRNQARPKGSTTLAAVLRLYAPGAMG